MALYAIGDLHLSTAVDKPMDVFGEAWSNHASRLADEWSKNVHEDDVVLIPGDISWGMTLEEAKPDLEWIAALPGKKIMIRGNHDYWWNGIGKVRNILPDGMYALQNDSLPLSDCVITGTRGWVLPSHPNFNEEDERILKREAHRLRLSLENAAQHGLPIICMIHYPPIGPGEDTTIFTNILEEFPVKLCIYGHLHGFAHRFARNDVHNGITYQLVSGDFLAFRPFRLERSWYK
ncbi:metallophosphoesterase [Alicyclobacillus dauci]|uniref:Metallophosphoesterase n=1 Tax=Alicyclobacillus dauci TaxID=1475485 RepID=A0ABY6YWZ9_9BACL|nr:metallophosphoesterase [Alicyclobacillus dauci]WAH34996.1 metallophosphoesterase [Alicyclobacillus dauci]